MLRSSRYAAQSDEGGDRDEDGPEINHRTQRTPFPEGESAKRASSRENLGDPDAGVARVTPGGFGRLLDQGGESARGPLQYPPLGVGEDDDLQQR
jgi:hypothetical protein